MTNSRRNCPCFNAEGRFSIVQEGVTPPPWGQLFVLFILMTGSAACISFYQPFLKEMVVSFGYQEADAGFYVGFVAASFHLGRLISSYAWGYLSDRFGRRPTLLTSLLLVSLCTLAFGFSRSFGFASAVGLVTGLVNGVVIVGKAQIYDISDTSNQSYGIASLSLSWGLGSLIGPMLGGFLAKYRAVPTFPYLVPSIALSAIAGAILLLSCWLLKEPKRAGISIDLDEIEKPVATAAAAPLILVEAPTEGEDRLWRRWASAGGPLGESGGSPSAGKESRRQVENGDASAEAFRSLPSVQPRPARAAAHGGSVSRSVALLAAVSAENCLVLTAAEAPDAAAAEEAAKPADEKAAGRVGQPFLERMRASNLGRILLNCECIKVMTQYFLQSMCSVYLNTLVIVWIPTSSYYGGLGFSAQSLATLLSISAVSLFVFQPIVFPLLERRLGATRLFMHTLMLTLVCSATLPLAHYALHTPALVWTLCIALLCLLNQAILTSFSCTALMVNNSVPVELVGSMNGMSMAWSSLGRLLGPLLSGSLFAASIDSGLDYPLDFNLSFQLAGLLVILCALLGCRQSTRLNSKFSER
ncbi:hypothetical protein BOX15_Mlig018159g2 [Macrostomum lignano]|uniref:Major facilitator superfamily (MFS) profile domain-containing protein n=2 Tax=Macrostomum lignano TaxID=282301 RepID=A0A267G7H6_9PLAT|nr:hypothetical protein BOX15_Mlig018159g2 [Macrostomum lignano]